MYKEMNSHIDALLDSLGERYVANYEWLIEHRHEVETNHFQANYRLFWAMNQARLRPEYYRTYFQELKAAQRKLPTISELIDKLYEIPTHNNGIRKLQFSFYTKLLHTADPTLPIYDSQVASFYFVEQREGIALQEKINHLLAFYSFLKEEYARILSVGLLREPIAAFRNKFVSTRFTDEKIIDSLLWAYIGLLRQGAAVKRVVRYQ